METQDRISALPNEILCFILSFLSTWDAISTSLLSKRWQRLWLFVPILDLDNNTFIRSGRSYSSFFNFAYAALLSRSVQQPITLARFCLNFYIRGVDNFPYPHFKIWVNTIVQRGLQHLHIEIPHAFELPSTILRCETLVVLKLCRLRVNDIGLVHLPALKTLHLNYFSMLETRYIAEILCGCPVLEDLQVNYMFFNYISNVVEFQSMPKLVRADIKVNYRFEIPLKVVCNVEYLRFSLEFDEECFPVFHNLIHLEINFGIDIHWHLVFDMLKNCPKLQSFVIVLPLLSLTPKTWTCPQFAPECISSQLRKCTIMNYQGKKCELQFAKYIMQNSRALQTMTIDNTNLQDSPEMLQELAMCPRSSTTCRLLYK